MPDDLRKFKILSIDSGGIRSIYSAKILERFEFESGIPIYQCFDLICGTGSGGLIALALSIGKSVNEIVNYFEQNYEYLANHSTLDNCNCSFNGLANFFLHKLGFTGNKKDAEFKNSLEDFFGISCLEDALLYLCLPCYDLNTNTPIIFRKNHNDLFRAKNIRMSEVALSICAKYSTNGKRIHKYEHWDSLYTTGEIWAYNPALWGLTEALLYFYSINSKDSRYTGIELLSIPAFQMKNQPENKPLNKKMLWELSLDGQSYFTNFMLSVLSENILNKYSINYQRIPVIKRSIIEDLQIKSVSLSNEKFVRIIKDFAENDNKGLIINPNFRKFFCL